MRIGFLIADMESGGAQRTTAALANWFADCGNEVTVLTIQNTLPFFPLSAGVDCRAMKLAPLGGGIKRIFGVFRRIITMRSQIKAEGFDCFIGMSNIMSAYAVVTTLFTRTKSVGTERTNPFACNSSILSFMRCFFSLFTDGYVFQTEGARAFFPKLMHKRSRVIPNAVFSRDVPKSNGGKRDNSVCTMCRLSPEKGIDVLISAFEAVRAQSPDCVLKIYGEGPELENLKALVHKKELGGVIFEGACPDAIAKIRSDGVFVLSSRVEGMPNALIEAMAAGLPCVSTRCKLGPEELIEDGVNGLLVPVDAPAEMATAILRLLQNRQLADSLAENAKLISKRLSIEKIGSEWLNYLNGVIKNA